jgi:hypothetical protein
VDQTNCPYIEFLAYLPRMDVLIESRVKLPNDKLPTPSQKILKPKQSFQDILFVKIFLFVSLSLKWGIVIVKKH